MSAFGGEQAWGHLGHTGAGERAAALLLGCLRKWELVRAGAEH